MKHLSKREINNILIQGESSTIEFKRKIASDEKIAKEITALSNTLGGLIFIGVDDNGSVYGIKSEKSDISIIEYANNTLIDPPVLIEIDILEYDNKDIILIKVPNSSFKPHKLIFKDDLGKLNKKVFIRVGEKSVLASSEMARLLKYQNSNEEKLVLSIGDKEKYLFNYLEKHERITVIEYCKLCNISKRRSERLLIRLVRAKVLQIITDTHHDYFTFIK